MGRDFLGSLGTLFAIFKMIADAVLEIGGSDEDIVKINGNVSLAKDIANVICGQAEVVLHKPKERLFSVLFPLKKIRLAELPRDSRMVIIGELVKVFRNLEPREQKFVKLRYGLDDGKTHTYDEIGGAFRLSFELTREIDVKVLQKLKNSSSAEIILQEHKRAISRFGPDALYEVSSFAEEILAKPVSELNFTVRVRKFLESNNIVTIGGLVQLSAEDIRSNRHIGHGPEGSVSQIREQLLSKGLKLRGDR